MAIPIKEQLAGNIVGHWNLRTGSISDQSENGNDATFVGTPRWQNGVKGRGLFFDSTNALSVADSAELQTLNMTIVVFGDFQKQTSGARYLYKRDAGGTHVDFFNSSSTDLAVWDGSAQSSLNADIIGSKMVAFTLTSGNAPAFYIDGVNVGSGSSASTITANDAPIILGNSTSGGAGNPVDNLLHEIIFFDTVLTNQQMSELYNEWLQEAHLDAIPERILLPEQTDLTEIAPDNLVISLNMNVQGVTVFDTSGNGNDGTIIGTVADTEGLFGRALDFDGVQGYVLRNNTASVQNIWDGGGTVGAWIFPRSMGEGNAGRIIDKNQWLLATIEEAAGFCKATILVQFSGDDTQWITTNRELALNAWNRVVVTYNSDSTTNEAIIYVNGKSVAVVQTPADPTGTRSTDAGSGLTIGNKSTQANTFDGPVELPQMWNTILTPTQAAQDYEQAQFKLDLNYTGEDWNVSNADYGGTVGGLLENTPFHFNETGGRWQVDDNSDGETGKQITNGTAGVISIPSQQVLGTWEFGLYKSADGNTMICSFMAEVDGTFNSSGQESFELQITSGEQLVLSKRGTGATTIGSTATSFVAISTWYMLRITKDSDGEFNVYILGGSFADWTLAITGTNTSVVSSKFSTFDIDSADAFRNIRFSPTIKDPTA